MARNYKRILINPVEIQYKIPYISKFWYALDIVNQWGEKMSKNIRIFGLSILVVLLQGCGYNTLQTTDETIKSSWAEVVNQYQRRADLIPNLVNTVKGYASHEKDVFTSVTNARAKVGAIQANSRISE